ncbi:hypothetical protein P7C70_g5966, partial [Phenoliferia sp. Uapishka_3]
MSLLPSRSPPAVPFTNLSSLLSFLPIAAGTETSPAPSVVATDADLVATCTPASVTSGWFYPFFPKLIFILITFLRSLITLGGVSSFAAHSTGSSQVVGPFTPVVNASPQPPTGTFLGFLLRLHPILTDLFPTPAGYQTPPPAASYEVTQIPAFRARQSQTPGAQPQALQADIPSIAAIPFGRPGTPAPVAGPAPQALQAPQPGPQPQAQTDAPSPAASPAPQASQGSQSPHPPQASAPASQINAPAPAAGGKGKRRASRSPSPQAPQAPAPQMNAPASAAGGKGKRRAPQPAQPAPQAPVAGPGPQSARPRRAAAIASQAAVFTQLQAQAAPAPPQAPRARRAAASRQPAQPGQGSKLSLKVPAPAPNDDFVWPKYFGRKWPKGKPSGRYADNAQAKLRLTVGGGGVVYNIDKGRYWDTIEILGERFTPKHEYLMKWHNAWLTKPEYEDWVLDVLDIIGRNNYGCEWLAALRNTWIPAENAHPLSVKAWRGSQASTASDVDEIASDGNPSESGSESGNDGDASGSGAVVPRKRGRTVSM